MRRWHAAAKSWAPVRGQQARGRPLLTLLGEHPGTEEVVEGAPFVGKAGAALNEALAAAAIPRAQCDVDNGIACGLPKNIVAYDVIESRLRREKEDGLSPDHEQHPALHCKPRLWRVLQRASCVVPMGGGIASVVLGAKAPITRIAGAPKPAPEGTQAKLTVPTISPAYVARRQRYAPMLAAHLGRAMRFARGAPQWDDPQRLLFPTPEQVGRFLFPPGIDPRSVRWTYDLEATGADDKQARDPRRAIMDCIGIGRDRLPGDPAPETPEQARAPIVLVVSVRSWEHTTQTPIHQQPPGFGLYTPAEWAFIEALVRTAFMDGREWWGHNAGNYDRQLLRSNLPAASLPVGKGGAMVPFPVCDVACKDTVLYHSLAWSEWRHSLSVLGAQYTDAPAWKDDYADTRAGTEVRSNRDRADYCGLDVAITHVCEPQVVADAEAFGQTGEVPAMPGWTLPQLMHRLQEVGQEMSMLGIPVNQQERDAKEQAVAARVHAAIAEAAQAAAAAGWRATTLSTPKGVIKPRPFNAASVFHVRELLFDLLLLPELAQTDTGDPSTDGHVLLAFLQKAGYPDAAYRAVRAVRRVRAVGKEASMLRPLRMRRFDPEYGRVDDDGRLRVSWNIHTPTTTRYSSSDPFNLQNVPKWMRSLFEAPDGWEFVGADMDALEGRMAAIHWQLTQFVEAFARQDDTHQITMEITAGDAVWRMVGAPPPDHKYRKGWPAADGTWAEISGAFDEYRTLCKRWFFAKLYGANDQTVIDILKEVENVDDQGNSIFPFAGLTAAKAEAMTNALHARVPQLKKGWDGEIARVRRLGYNVDGILGRRRRFGDGVDDSYNEILNFPIQTGGVGIVHRGMLRFLDACPPHFAGRGSGLVQQGHDALAALVPTHVAEQVAKIMTEALTQTFPSIYPGMVFSAKAKRGRTWKSVC